MVRSASANAHKRIRCTCKYCVKGYTHHKHHQSHGEGSFKRTHPTYCKTNTCNSPKSSSYKRKKKGLTKCYQGGTYDDYYDKRLSGNKKR